jgi:energy-converting hydrogenase A subunit R
MTPSSVTSQTVFISDCEGPITKNDNAYELTSHFIPDGSSFFTLISRYDDILADITRRKGYRAGSTLKLILPFLKAYGVTDDAMKDFSSKNILLVPDAKEAIRFIMSSMPSFIVSTSYEQYMHALCGTVDFPFENVHCTRVNLDKYELDWREKIALMKLKEEMTKLTIPDVPSSAQSLSDLPERAQKNVVRLDEIFWNEISSMEISRILNEVNPIGGLEKAEAIKDIEGRLERSLHDIMYVGDSITDMAAFKLVRSGGGLTVSFNGNAYAVRESEVAVLSESAIVTAMLADAFRKFGKAYVFDLIRNWEPSTLEKFGLSQAKKRIARVELVTSKNMERLTRESTDFRKTVRGEAIGRLG